MRRVFHKTEFTAIIAEYRMSLVLGLTLKINIRYRIYQLIENLKQGCSNPVGFVARSNKFSYLAPNIFSINIAIFPSYIEKSVSAHAQSRKRQFPVRFKGHSKIAES
jgi:hypothetical protein